VLGQLRRTIRALSRSTLHGCLGRHGVGRHPLQATRASKRSRVDDTELRCAHVRRCGLRLAEGHAHRVLAIGRVSEFTHAAFHETASKPNGAAFLQAVLNAFPYRIHTVLTDNGAPCTDPRPYRDGPGVRRGGWHHFGRICRQHGIKHHRTKPYQPWTNGQAGLMNRTMKQATVQAVHSADSAAMKARVLAFVTARNVARHLNVLRWRTLPQTLCEAWARTPARFRLDPPP
jgi:transposase InsO family protein